MGKHTPGMERFNYTCERSEGETVVARWLGAKFPNRRVAVALLSNGRLGVEMKNLLGWKNVRYTRFALSREAAEALKQLIAVQLCTPEFEAKGE